MYQVKYFTGGWANRKMHYTIAFTQSEAQQHLEEVQRMGYAAEIVAYAPDQEAFKSYPCEVTK